MTQRILLVDDEEPILAAAEEYFTARGYEVDSAREREEAEALLASIRYALVVADLRLTGTHGREGLELLAYLRARCPRTLVVLLTGCATPELEVELHRRGADAVLRKPQPLPEVARLVADLLQRRVPARA